MSIRSMSVWFACAALVLLAVSVQAEDYQHSLQADKMTFAWSVQGENLAVKLSAPTTGWVAVGFNPSSRMKDADIIIGYVKDGTTKIVDEFGTAATQHKSDGKVGGSDNVTVVGGSETGNTTTIEFTIPLNSGDDKDTVIDPAADTVVILAYGPDRDSFRMKHAFNATVTVNLGSGAQK